MPVEHELKFVMRMDCEEQVRQKSEKRFTITQGYLPSGKGTTLRIRSSRKLDDPKSTHKYFMTFKQTVRGVPIEIENRIDQRDFDLLWPTTMNKLEKVRYKVLDPKRGIWDVDFFLDHHDHTYFVMAEHEMPEGQKKPDAIPKVVSENLVYSVPLTDTRFSSKLLADVRYAKSLFADLKKKHA